MSAKIFLLVASALLLGASLAMATQMQGVPGGGTPATGGKGPGMGHDYRRNAGGPGMGPRDAPHETTAVPQQPALPEAAPTSAPRQPGRGYGYPGYRGHGDSPYPGHRQYANPPLHPVPAPREQE